jgi:hypothetical protein
MAFERAADVSMAMQTRIRLSWQELNLTKQSRQKPTEQAMRRRSVDQELYPLRCTHSKVGGANGRFRNSNT